MDLELKKIYDTFEKYNMIDGISDIKADMEQLNEKLTEYKGMSRLNSYNVPNVICEIDKMNTNIEKKYDNYFKKYNSSNFNINVFGAGNDTFEQKIEGSLNALGKIAVLKICNYYGIDVMDSQLNTSNSDLYRLYNTSVANFSNTDDDILDTKMSFKVIY